MLKFYWNGIKDNGDKLQRCHYSVAPLLNHPTSTITIYARDYSGFSQGVRNAFTVQNDSEMQTDYFEKDRIRVTPTHPLYGEVMEAVKAANAHHSKLYGKKAA